MSEEEFNFMAVGMVLDSMNHVRNVEQDEQDTIITLSETVSIQKLNSLKRLFNEHSSKVTAESGKLQMVVTLPEHLFEEDS